MYYYYYYDEYKITSIVMLKDTMCFKTTDRLGVRRYLGVGVYRKKKLHYYSMFDDKAISEIKKTKNHLSTHKELEPFVKLTVTYDDNGNYDSNKFTYYYEKVEIL